MPLIDCLPRQRGFTLTELMVIIGLMAVLAGFAAPSLRDFIVRKNLESVTGDFQSDIMKARTTAMNKNICVTMCMSSNAGGNSPTCATSGSDWQPGWIVFLNPACNGTTNTVPSDPNDPASPNPRVNLIGARVGLPNDYYLNSQSANAVRRFNFDPRGSTSLSSAAQFNAVYMSVGNALTERYARNVCVDGLARTRTIPNDKSCATY